MESYGLRLLTIGSNRTEAIKLLSAACQGATSMRLARDILDGGPPILVHDDLDRGSAERLKRLFEGLGATVELFVSRPDEMLPPR